MGFFSRKDKIVDLTDEFRYTKKAQIKEDSESPSSDGSSAQSQESSQGRFFNFFGNSNASNSSPSSEVSSYSGNFDPETGKPIDAQEKRRRLARRLKDMTDSIESLSNQMYLLQQRIELLEKRIQKKDINQYE